MCGQGQDTQPQGLGKSLGIKQAVEERVRLTVAMPGKQEEEEQVTKTKEPSMVSLGLLDELDSAETCKSSLGVGAWVGMETE